jgi:hypothetical protein
MGNIVKRGIESNYHPSLMVGPRGMSLLMYLSENGKTQGRDFFVEFGQGVRTSLAALRGRGLVLVTGELGYRNSVVNGSVIRLSAAGKKMASSYAKVNLPVNAGILGSQA